jgi:hypothetical protein
MKRIEQTMADPFETSQPLDRRTFVLSASALAAAVVGQAPAEPSGQTKNVGPAADPDPISALNSQFRGLYAANREELLATAPLAALTLIGTGEVWRIEFGKAVRSYPPRGWRGPRIWMALGLTRDG